MIRMGNSIRHNWVKHYTSKTPLTDGVSASLTQLLYGFLILLPAVLVLVGTEVVGVRHPGLVDTRQKHALAVEREVKPVGVQTQFICFATSCELRNIAKINTFAGNNE